ncbi:MAG: hypothetical protein KGJ23_09710 [Euryarchaeota archaeon]|nr:hypothetical protein [Euryarchaeota archaeon]MDE1836878.1 hypothetical protein [Euryarchaeota archaeon]MDE1881360.1 hypothetical protein [Euryarchaeota archaeon]MDE2045281.1 hypothetical protein [Thermoplasmata archaeon]
MPAPTDERSPRKNTPANPAPAPALTVPASSPLPSVGGKARSPTKFQPKYIPRLLSYDLPEYQDENWRQ